MKAVVLAGGQGSRLRPYTFTVPKPLLPLADRPLLDYIIAQLARSGVTDVILALGYQAELIRAYGGDGTRFGVRLAYVEESSPLGTAGPLRLCRPLLDPAEPFVVTNGDIVTQLDFGRLARFHAAQGATLTIGYVQHRHQSRFGVLRIEHGRVLGVEEKPVHVYPVSAGIYAVSPAALDLLPADGPMTMPELADRVREEGGIVAACEITEFWRALETRDHFEELVNDAATLDALAGPPGTA